MLKKEKVEGFYFVIYPVFKNCASLFPTTPGTYIITTVKRGVRKIHYIGASSNIQCRIKTHNKIIELKKMLKKGEVIEILIRAAILLVGRKLENVNNQLSINGLNIKFLENNIIIFGNRKFDTRFRGKLAHMLSRNYRTCRNLNDYDWNKHYFC